MISTSKSNVRILPILPYKWSSAWGEDRYGIWTEFEYQQVTQRLRWIPPGEFLMGSPESEPERYENESQHEVELIKGFWVADTACTQELWQAVMGNNPSRFKGRNRPVENVSWEDCQKFMNRINQEVPGLGVRFPTEAEWEYACRAGTSTPFWFGSRISTDQVNYDGRYPYAGGHKEEFRGQTVEVKTLPANGWGLYEMHGNVWEWCADWFGPYVSKIVFDPLRSNKDVDCVLRGGSWFGLARYCRSAHRYATHPGDRNDNVGLRLSRGQSSPGQD